MGKLAAAEGLLGVALAGVGVATAQPWLVGIGASLALGAVGSLIAPVPEAANVQSRKYTFQTPDVPLQYVYGRTRVPIYLMWATSFGDDHKVLASVFKVADHECDGLEGIYLNDTYVPLSVNGSSTSGWPSTDYIPTHGSKYWPSGRTRPVVSVFWHAGAPGDANDTYLISKSSGGWTTNHKGTGICWVCVRMVYDDGIFSSGRPEVSLIVRGKKLYDPRTTQTVFSKNVALVWADYLTSTLGYGQVGVAYSDIGTSSLIAAANVCEEQVEIDTGSLETENRYELGGVVLSTEARDAAEQKILLAMSGARANVDGTYQVFAGTTRPTVFDVVEDDLIGNIELDPRRALDELFNTIIMSYISETNDWGPDDTTEIKQALYITEDNNLQLYKRVSLDMVQRRSQAIRIGFIALLDNRQQITFTAKCRKRLVRLSFWDVVTINLPRYGWVDKQFTVVATSEEDDGITITFAEYTDDVFTLPVGTVLTKDPAPDFITYDPLTGIEDVANLTATMVYIVDLSGASVPAIQITWSAPAGIANEIDIQYMTTEKAWVSSQDTPLISSSGHGMAYVGEWKSNTTYANLLTFTSPPVEAFTRYTVQARFRNGIREGNWTSVDLWLLGTQVGPSQPYDLAVSSNGLDTITLSWKLYKDSEVTGTEIWYSTTGGSAVDRDAALAAGQRIAIVNTPFFSWASLAADFFAWFWVRNVSGDGTPSAWNSDAGLKGEVAGDLGALAYKNQVTTADIAANAVSGVVYTNEDNSTQVDSGYKVILTRTFNIALNASELASILTYWESFLNSDVPTGLQVNVRLRVDGNIVRTWKFSSDYTRALSGRWSYNLPSGDHTIDMQLQLQGAGSGQYHISNSYFETTVLKR